MEVWAPGISDQEGVAGVGRREGVVRGTGLGTRIVNAMARAIGGRVEYVKAERGTVATLAFSPAPES